MKKLKLLFGRFFRGIINEVFTARTKEILDAGTSRSKDLNLTVTELDTFGGLMNRKEFTAKLKHAIKLVDLRKEWIEASIFNRKGLPTIEVLLDLEKEIRNEYETARRGGKDKRSEALLAQGGLDAFRIIREELEK